MPPPCPAVSSSSSTIGQHLGRQTVIERVADLHTTAARVERLDAQPHFRGMLHAVDQPVALALDFDGAR